MPGHATRTPTTAGCGASRPSCSRSPATSIRSSWCRARLGSCGSPGTTLRRSELRELAELAARVNLRRVVAVRFTPPDYPEHLDKQAIARIRSVVRGALTGPPPPAAPLPTGKDCR
jgi:hypothetical protein